MTWLVDAQLPRRLSLWLTHQGEDAIHTLNLPKGNRTKDNSIIRFADLEERIVITKDADFVNSHLLSQQPKRLLLISTGNLNNRELEILITNALGAIRFAFIDSPFVELTRDSVIIHS